MQSFTLFKVHENSDCIILQDITRYIYYSSGISVFPTRIIERYIPVHYKLPTLVFDNGITLNGLSEIVPFFEKTYNISDIVIKATKFSKKYPSYRIRDISTHNIPKMPQVGTAPA